MLGRLVLVLACLLAVPAQAAVAQLPALPAGDTARVSLHGAPPRQYTGEVVRTSADTLVLRYHGHELAFARDSVMRLDRLLPHHPQLRQRTLSGVRHGAIVGGVAGIAVGVAVNYLNPFCERPCTEPRHLLVKAPLVGAAVGGAAGGTIGFAVSGPRWQVVWPGQ